MSVEFRQPEGLHGQSPGPGGPSRATDTDPPSLPAPWSLPRWRAYVAAAMLCYINLLNYMNWFIIAGEAGAGQAGQHLPPAAAVSTVALHPANFLLVRHISAILTSTPHPNGFRPA